MPDGGVTLTPLPDRGSAKLPMGRMLAARDQAEPGGEWPSFRLGDAARFVPVDHLRARAKNKPAAVQHPGLYNPRLSRADLLYRAAIGES